MKAHGDNHWYHMMFLGALLLPCGCSGSSGQDLTTDAGRDGPVVITAADAPADSSRGSPDAGLVDTGFADLRTPDRPGDVSVADVPFGVDFTDVPLGGGEDAADAAGSSLEAARADSTGGALDVGNALSTQEIEFIVTTAVSFFLLEAK